MHTWWLIGRFPQGCSHISFGKWYKLTFLSKKNKKESPLQPTICVWCTKWPLPFYFHAIFLSTHPSVPQHCILRILSISSVVIYLDLNCGHPTSLFRLLVSKRCWETRSFGLPFCIDLGLWSLRSPIPSIASYLFMMGGAGERWGLNSWGCNPDKWPNEGWTGWCSLCCCGCCCSINRGCCCSCCGCSVAAAAVAATVQDMMKFCIEASILRDGQKKHGAVMTIFCHPEGF